MPNNQEDKDYGAYITLNGQRRELERHPGDFLVLGTPAPVVEAEGAEAVERLTPRIVRATAAPENRDAVMSKVREEAPAYHVYRLKPQVADASMGFAAAAGRGAVEVAPEEVMFDDRLLVTLKINDVELIERIVERFHLLHEGRMGDSWVLRVTAATGENPLKTANRIAELDGVASAQPQVLMRLSRQAWPTETNPLCRRQWYLHAAQVQHPDVLPDADIDLPEAWEITTGSAEIVVAVIDDGFDLAHPALATTRLHPAEFDFGQLPPDTQPLPEQGDYHGTPVASIAVGSLEGKGMVGVAPGCTFLPVRIGFNTVPPVDMLQVFRYVSKYADVVNCSFGLPPTSYDPFPTEFRKELTALTRFGGRRGKGLVMVFSAANDDAPTYLSAAANKNGVLFTSGSVLAGIPKNQEVFSGYPMTAGLTVVAAMSSRKRKSGYSCWGPHITVTAPSNNGHYIMQFVSTANSLRQPFVANYRGLGQIAASNRPGVGVGFLPMPDDPDTPMDEHMYTSQFGGTSGAAPVVTGIVGLMLSANPALSAQEVNRILEATADQDLDTELDNPTDPNLQGLSGAFKNGRSLFFGAGKVNARRAVQRARALASPAPASPSAGLGAVAG